MARGLGGFSVSDIPLLSRTIAWADERIKAAVEYTLRKYAEFERAAQEAPAIREDAHRMRQAIRDGNGTPVQLAEADRYVAEADRLAVEAANRGPVDKVVEWVMSTRASSGMGAGFVVPVAIGSAALIAIVVVNSTLKSYNEAQIVRALIRAGMSPEQIARFGVRGSPFADGISSITKLLGLAALVFGGVYLYRAVAKK